MKSYPFDNESAWYNDLDLYQHLANLSETENNTVSLWSLDSHEIRYVSVLYGQLKEKILKTSNLMDLILPEDREAGQKLIDAAILTDDKIFKIEYRLENRFRQRHKFLSIGKIFETGINGKMTRAFGISVDISRKYKMEKEIERRERYLSAVAKAAHVLLPSDSDIAYNDFLDAIGFASGASRVYVFLNYPDEQGKLRQNQIAEWCAKGIKSQMGNPILQGSLYEEVYPGWENTLKGGGIIRGRTAEFEEPTRANLESQEVKAILALPIIIRGKFAGYIGFDNCVDDRSWSQVEVDFLSTSASHLTQALKRKETMVSLKKSETKLRNLSSHLMTIQENERKRIAEELHDELGQSLLVLKLQINTICRRMHDNLLKERCEQAMQYTDQVIENVRRLSHDLRPLVLEGLGLTTALQALIKEFAENSQMKISTNMINIDSCFNDEAQIIIYRVFQEALTNIGKHAGADNIYIAIQKNDGTIACSIKDDGCGFDLDELKQQGYTSYGMGLPTMSERLNMLGGRIEIFSKSGSGCEISFTVPTNCKG
jgi:signal transduction histidine kinase